MENKLRIGIDINEILRARWLQFDRYYVQEFDEEGVPENPYVYDFFKNYKWSDVVENINYLNEDLPEDIHPQFYQIDETTGEAPVDSMAFRKRTVELTARQVYERFMYEDFLFELHGSAPMMYKGMDQHIEKFYYKYKDNADFCIVSKENHFSIPPTLFFLSKILTRMQKYFLVSTNEEIWENVDVLITTDPELLKNVPLGKKVIKAKRPYNEEFYSEIEIIQINDLSTNKDFQNLINYVEPEIKVEVKDNTPTIELL